MAIASIAQAYAGSVNNSSVTTSSVDTTGANLIVIVVAYGSAPTISDSKGNSYTALTARGSPAVRMYYCASPTVGTGHTFTASGDGICYPSIVVIAVSGAAASPYDQESGTASGTQPGSITPSENDCLLVSGGNFNISAAPTSASGMTLIAGVANAGTNYTGGGAYVIQTTASALNPTWDQTGALAMASFKSSTAAGVVKTVDGLAFASVKTVNGLAIASVKTINGAATA